MIIKCIRLGFITCLPDLIEEGVQIEIAKITRPTFAKVLHRKRLFRLIDQGRRHPVIYVSGPAGSGKTTLVSSYLDSRKIPCLWYKVDEGDADITTFFYYMGLAAKKAAPGKRRPLPLLTPEYQMGIPTFTKRYFENLYSRLKSSSVIVFDNYQEAPVDSAFQEIMHYGLSAIPGNLNVILASRTNPPPVFISMLANNLISVIDWENLRLMPEESGEIMRLHLGKKFTKETVQTFHEKTKGWAAGLVLMAKAKTEDIDPHLLGKISQEKIFDYFAGEIFDKSNALQQDFLKKTAFLPQIMPRVAEKLTELNQSGRILSDLSARNYFIEKHYHAGPSYQYHPLFREFLLTRAKRTYSKDEISLIKRRAAAILEESGRIEDAAEFYIETGSWEGLVSLILLNAQQFIMQGRSSIIEKWLTVIPKEFFEHNPWLLYWKGVCRFPFDPKESEGYFNKAFEFFESRQDAAGVFLSWAGVVESVVNSFEDFLKIDTWTGLLDELMKKFGAFPSPEIENRVYSTMFMALTMRHFSFPDYDLWKERALAKADDRSRLHTLFHVIVNSITVGNSIEAEYAINELQKLSKLPAATPFDLIAIKYAEVMHYRLNDAYGRSITAAQEALEIADRTGVHFLDFMILGNALLSAFACEDFASASSLMKRMSVLGEYLRPLDKAFYHNIVSIEGLLEGDYSKALTHIDLSYRINNTVNVPYGSVCCRFQYALVMHALQNHEKANMYLEQAYKLLHKMNSNVAEFDYRLAKAYFALDHPEPKKNNIKKQGLKDLRKAISIGKEAGLQHSFFPWHPLMLSHIFGAALEHGIEADYVLEIIKRRRLFPDEKYLHLDNWPWRLRIYTMGGFNVMIDGKAVSFEGKVQKKPIEMLKALVAFGGYDVREDQISDALWPDADGDTARISFKTTLHRLRKIVENSVNNFLGRSDDSDNKGLPGDAVIQYSDARLSLNSRFCWVDVRAFERMLCKAEKPEEKEPDRIKLLEKAVDMYKGHFLKDDSGKTWIFPAQERMRSKFLNAITLIGKWHENEGTPEKAISFYHRGLEIDDLAEEFYYALIKCNKELGNKAEAIKIYNRCKKILSTQLGIEPSPETERIYASIREERSN